MALRLSKVYPTASDYAATQFKAALADGAGSIATNADNFTLVYPGGNFKNPYYNMYDGRKDYGESETMTTCLPAWVVMHASPYSVKLPVELPLQRAFLTEGLVPSLIHGVVPIRIIVMYSLLLTVRQPLLWPS